MTDNGQDYENFVRWLIIDDPESMTVLSTVESLHLPDWAIGAGFVRSLVWDYLHGYTARTPLSDIDVLYFDRDDVREDSEKRFDQKLCELLPGRPWSVKNQARMHVKGGYQPFADTLDGMRHWLETPTAVAAKLNQGRLEFLAPFGFADLCRMIIRPTPAAEIRIEVYRARVSAKPWRAQWPRIKVFGMDDNHAGMKQA